MRRVLGRWAAACLLLAALLPPAWILHLIWTRGVNVPYVDEWDLVPFVLRAHAGEVTLADIWAQHNEHRIAAVRIIVLLLLPLTRFDMVPYMLLAFATALASLGCFWRALQLTVGRLRPDLVPVLLFAISLLMFSTVQYEAWVYAMPAMNRQMGTLCVALTVWALARWPGSWQPLGVGAVCTIVSMLTSISGLALWGAALIGVFLVNPSAYQHRVRKAAVPGSAVIVAFLMFYFSGYERPPHHPSPFAALLQPWAALRFVSAYFGAPLAVHLGLQAATIAGAAALIVAFAVLCVSFRTVAPIGAGSAPWIALGVYATAVAAITAVGRVEMSSTFALAPRYSASAVLLWVAVLALAALVWSDLGVRMRRTWRHAVVTTASLVLLLTLVGYVGAYRYGSEQLEAFHLNLSLVRPELYFLDSAPEFVFQYSYPPDPTKPRRYSALLAEAGLGPFAWTESRAKR